MSKQKHVEAEVVASGKLNEVVKIVKRRPNGRLRIQQDFSFCPSMAEQHTAHLTDLNYLIEKYKPDELASYLAAKMSHRQVIENHDFSKEPNLQDAKNVIYQSKQNFEALPDEVKYQFKNHVEFLKFIDNPANAEKMYKLGLLTPRQVESIKIPDEAAPNPTTTPTKSASDKEKKEEK